MIPKYKKPNNDAIFIGRSENADGLQEYWILPPSSGVVYVFVVTDNDSFATRVLTFSQKEPVRTNCGWPEPNWFRHCNLGMLYMSVPESSCCLGMQSIVFDYIWNMLYEQHEGGSGFGLKLHPDGHHIAEVASLLMRALTKAGMPLTEKQDMFLFENYLMRK